jgi:hypothetical protein
MFYKKLLIATKTPRHKEKILKLYFVSLCLGGKNFHEIFGLGFAG